jgi:hypothetical protein
MTATWAASSTTFPVRPSSLHREWLGLETREVGLALALSIHLRFNTDSA